MQRLHLEQLSAFWRFSNNTHTNFRDGPTQIDATNECAKQNQTGNYVSQTTALRHTSSSCKQRTHQIARLLGRLRPGLELTLRFAARSLCTFEPACATVLPASL